MAKKNVISIVIYVYVCMCACLRPSMCVSRGSPVLPASMPERCPSPPCECGADELNRKRVTCATGTLTSIEVDKMDRAIQVLNVTGGERNRNRITLGRIFQDFDALEEVHITHSSLPAIGDSSFWPGRRLAVLNLSHNNISLVRDTDFNGLSSLLALDLSSNRLSRLPSAAFHQLSSLTKLSLARNQLTKLVTRLFYKLQQLELLDLSGNPLAEIGGDDLKDVPNLRHLNVAHCELERVHSLVYDSVPKLSVLDVSRNRITSISAHEFKSLSKLHELRLNGNQIVVLNDYSFSGLRELRLLDLSSNLIVSLSSCTFCNASVRGLDISHNKFTSFESRALEPLSDSLSALNASANRHLIDASLSIAQLVRPLKRLEHLHLTDNRLDDSIIESTFYNTQSLVSLNMSSNKFVNMSWKLLSPLTRLQTLDLSHNQIYGLSEIVFERIDAIPTLTAVYLSDNPWSCYRCHILPTLYWIDKSPKAYYNVCHRYAKDESRLKFCIRCERPSQLSAVYLHTIREYELQWCSDPSVQLRLTASEPQVGLILAFLIIVSLVIVIIAVIVFYRQQSAVYYTHEDLSIDQKTPVFSVASPSNTNVKQFAVSRYSTSTITSPTYSKPESPSAGPSMHFTRPRVAIYI